jgi:hypothetical protein
MGMNRLQERTCQLGGIDRLVQDHGAGGTQLA